MDRPKVRNEFGLDNENALDIQKEHAKRVMPWVVGVGALLAAFILMMFVLPNMPNNSGTHVPSTTPTTTTGSR